MSRLSHTSKTFTSIMTAALICLAACGSDKKDTTSANNGNATTGPNPSVVNSDKTGKEPVLTPQSPDVKLTQGTKVTPLVYVNFSSNANATVPAKANRLSAYDYDICVFSANHGYSTFPQGAFNFVGFYLVNQTPGAPLAVGTYTVGNSGMYIDTTNSGDGLDIVSCTAQGGYKNPASGSITVTSLGTGTSSVLGFAGNMNVTMTDGSVFSGDFSSGTCTGGDGSAPNPPAVDPYACATIH